MMIDALTDQEQQTPLPLQCELDITTAINEIGEDLVREKWPKLLVEHVDVMTAAFIQKKKMDKQQASDLAFFIVDITARHHDGKLFYLPIGERLESAVKHKRIYNDWNKGMGLPELSKKYHITEMALYKTIAQQRKLHRKEIETPMPGIPTEEEYLASTKD